jgi:hypothetical protein
MSSYYLPIVSSSLPQQQPRSTIIIIEDRRNV